MLILLLFILVAGLGGLLLFGVAETSVLDAIQGPGVPATVLAAMIVFYLATAHGGGLKRAASTLAVAVALAVAVLAYRNGRPIALANLYTGAATDDSASLLIPNAPASVRLRRDDEGSFHANSEVNGISLSMLVDTGAATVVLRQSDAEKAGIDVAALSFDTALKSANSTAYLAPVRLKSVRVGGLRVDDVEALVAKPGTLNESLLGTSFLRRLASYQVAGDFLTLRQ